MNNLRLLTGVFIATLVGTGTRAAERCERVMQLDELFKIAEQNSRQLRPSFDVELETERDVAVARSRRLPDINTSLSMSYIGDGFTTRRDLTGYQKAPIPHIGNGLSLNITQPIYSGGAITGNIDMSELKLTAARYATQYERDNIRFQLTGFYLDIFKYRNLCSVVKKNIQQARIVLEQMTARYEQGTALQNDITRYELLVSNLELQLIKMNNTLEILNNNLAVTAGLNEGTVVIPDSTLLARALPSESQDWWQQEANVNSPSLKLARTSVDISRQAEVLVKSDNLPKIGLQASWTIDGPILVEIPPINRNLSYWYVGVGVSYNLSSLYKNNKSLAKSRAATRLAYSRLDATTERIDLAVRADYIKYLEAYEEMKTQLKSVELAEQNYVTTSTRYNADMALITDMLDATNAKFDAEQQLVNARINIIYYYYKLLFTAGKI